MFSFACCFRQSKYYLYQENMNNQFSLASTQNVGNLIDESQRPGYWNHSWFTGLRNENDHLSRYKMFKNNTRD